MPLTCRTCERSGTECICYLGKPKVWNTRDPQCPADAVYIGRGSKYGNPFVMGTRHVPNRDTACDLYEQYIEANPERKQDFIEELRGKDLVCFCAPQRCHGDYLIAIANE